MHVDICDTRGRERENIHVAVCDIERGGQRGGERDSDFCDKKERKKTENENS